ncbi:MAG: ParA family protein [Azoarcus sp.]|jgi:cellulose biosynthesis protein BcsQ|nr:ParA family protein [Azoarcus sp.]
MKTLAFFNNKGGVGKTSLVYHLAWMFTEQGLNVLAVDLDPQANLTAMFLRESRLEQLWPDDNHPKTVLGAIQPILEGLGDVASPHLEKIPSIRLSLVPGDLGLSRFEDKLSDAWPRCHNGDAAAFRAMTAFYRMAHAGGEECRADIILMDVGPNLGAINRAALIAADHVVVPLAADLFSLQGLRNLGPTLREWRRIWERLLPQKPENLNVPKGTMQPIGYVVSQHGILESRPVRSYQRWLERIPGTYRQSVLGKTEKNAPESGKDPNALALLKHYRSLMPMAMEAHKPIFALKSADGAIGSHIEAVHACHEDFLNLARRIAALIGLDMDGS